MTVSLDDLPLRDDLRGLRPYGAPQAPLPVALNVNENTHPVPENVASDILDEVAVALRDVNRYPDREFTELREAFAGYLGHGLDGVEHLGGQRLERGAAAHPAGVRRVRAARSSASLPPTRCTRCSRRAPAPRWVAGARQPDYELSPETEAVAQIEEHDPDVILLCAPNNPTGTPLPLDVIEAVYEASRGIVIVDEAYQEFAPKDSPSALTLLEGRPRLAVSRTMSKAFAFAGARVGYLAADPAFIDALRLVRLPYHLSALTQAAAVAALRNAPIMLAMVDEIVAQRDRISATLEALGYEPHPSWANFVLFGGVTDPAATWRALYDKGVLIRDVGIAGHLRVTAGTEAETTAFLDALASVGSAS